MFLLGLDIGSSSVKAALVDAETGKNKASSFFPKQEMTIAAPQPGWAEQQPDMWWQNMKMAVAEVLRVATVSKSDIKGIGISYQMHGLVMVDRLQQVLRPAIIWCDSRAVDIGKRAFERLGSTQCLSHMLNSPGNFTASKLRWVRENEPETYRKIHKVMLPGDYIAMRLTGDICTTVTGLSEGIFWDYINEDLSGLILGTYDIDRELMPVVMPAFGTQGELTGQVADELGLAAGTPVAYRAGDQPNNAFSLNVLEPGEVAATAGTSGVIYGVSDQLRYDPLSRVNTFAHVNYTPSHRRLGVLLCINGTGILNSWVRNHVAGNLSYEAMNELAATIQPGADGLTILPFGNGAERVLSNANPGCSICNLQFNQHGTGHIIRAAQEGIVYALKYGMDIMAETGMMVKVIRAGKTNMFLSTLFREALATVTGATIELYNTDGAHGAAVGVGVGTGIYPSFPAAFRQLQRVGEVHPVNENRDGYLAAYGRWRKYLDENLQR